MSGKEFADSNVTYDACILNFINIGEQVKSLTETFLEKHHHIPFRKIIGLRNLTAHSYEGLEPLLLFQSVQNDIPVLLDQISEIIKLEKFD
ncbi:DUF86 domain-containing protein [Aggregatimonas sangjinii]|uniref:DUF86 domain-containing protein n=2 Tax=Aggregatimonas sangjinii TaxID=2583587 RepID=A0A5B7SYE8_9FLAO|nr:DUF86 domain-containing protein [Aggregatimonas sangjinii]